jgi:NADPH-dependent 2,4-dienoyl-CoA reductase/sulfur reductase-like enzyme
MGERHGDSPDVSTGVLRVERKGAWQEIRYRNLILATGARELFLPFPGWTLPGVVGAGGLQALIKSGLRFDSNKGVARVVVAGSGPLLLALAATAHQSGAHVVSILEQAPFPRLATFGVTLLGHPSKLVEGADYRLTTWRAPYRTGTWVTRAEGRDRVESVTVTDGRKERTLPCDYLACGFHLVPNLELPRLLGCRIQAGFVAVNRFQETSVDGIFCVGELTGIGGLDKALIEGQIAGWAAVGKHSPAAALVPQAKRFSRFARRLDQAFAPRGELRTLASPDTIVCRCEDVMHGALQTCSSAREARLHTRCGMGACQGRVCGAANEFLFGWEHAGARPPVFPAKVATITGVEAKVSST